MESHTSHSAPTSPTITLFTPIAKHLSLPPDVNASESTGVTNGLVTSRPKWYRHLYLPWPVYYIIYISALIIFGFIALGLGLKTKYLLNRDDGRAPYRIAFWCFFGFFLGTLSSIIITSFIFYILLPAFWRKRARAVVKDGTFSFSPSNNNHLANHKHGYKTVLEVGCNDGHISAIFAREMIRAQKDTDLGRHIPNLPIFIGYDMWKWWVHMPNTPKAYLRTLLDAKVPRDHIIANRVDLTSKQTKLHLPYADNSISLIISNLALPDVTKWNSIEEQITVFKELARVLEPGGRMIVLENNTLNPRHASIRGGPMEKFRRILVDELGWSKENAKTRWAWCIMQYLDATKPVSNKLVV